MMGIALGGIGVLSLRTPSMLTTAVVNSLDLSSVLLAVFLVFLFGLTAYFTNPTEVSFRAFLTEMTFRQHLSKLTEAGVEHDELDDETGPHNTTRPPDHSDDDKYPTKHHNLRQQRTPSNGQSNNSNIAPSDSSPAVFHFANKASVSFRSPPYDLRNFFVLTLAFVPPVEMTMLPQLSSTPHGHPKPISWQNPTTHGQWFIGAFGRWWLGLELAMRPRTIKLSAQDDAAINEAEAAARQEEGGDSHSSLRPDEIAAQQQPKHHATHAHKLGVARRAMNAPVVPRTKAALRERISLQLSSNKQSSQHPSRPTTPPPLPKSASLPLHAKRVPVTPEPLRKTKTSGNNASTQPLLPTSAAPPPPQDHSSIISPVISELIQQLEAARNATADLQSQLEEVHASSAKTVARLQEEVSAARETKKKDDEGRGAIKARTKVLDDARRHAEGNKREAEKRLKAANTKKDRTTGRIAMLDKEVENLNKKMEEKKASAEESKERTQVEKVELEEEVGRKKTELKGVEEKMQIFSAKARELESMIAEEVEKLAKLKAEKEKDNETNPPWPPPLSSRPSPQTRIVALAPTPLTFPSRSSSLDTPSYSQSSFRPFADSPIQMINSGPLSPVTSSLIPSSLMKSMEMPLQTSLGGQSYFPIPSHPSATGSASSLTLYDEPVAQRSIRFEDTVAERPTPFARQHPRPPSPAVPPELPKQRRWFLPSSSSSTPVTTASTPAAGATSNKEKGLNPDAKVFTLPTRSSGIPALFGHSAPELTSNGPMYTEFFAPGNISSSPTPNDAFPSLPSSDLFDPPPSLMADYPPNTSTNMLTHSPTSSPPPAPAASRMSRIGAGTSLFPSFPSFHNPFSPSPAEREVLQRALASGNTSRERVGVVGSGLERVSSHGSGSGSGSSHHSSPSGHWLGRAATTGAVVAASGRGTTSSFDPWAGEGKE